MAAEQLRDVAAHRPVRRVAHCRLEPGDHRRAVLGDDDVLGVERAVRDARCVELVDLAPDDLQERVAEPLGAHVPERGTFGDLLGEEGEVTCGARNDDPRRATPRSRASSST